MRPVWTLFFVNRSRLQQELSETCHLYAAYVASGKVDLQTEDFLKRRIWFLNLLLGASPYD